MPNERSVLTSVACVASGAALFAEAGGLDRHVCSCQRKIETLPDEACFSMLAQSDQALMVTPQTPDIVRVVDGPRKR